MSNTVSSLREGRNDVYIVGILEQKNLEKKVKEGQNGDPDRNYIAGDLTIAVSDTEKYKVRFFSYEFNRNGAESKIYKGLDTVISEYKSVAELLLAGKSAEEARDEAEKISCSAKFGISDYVSKETFEPRSRVELRASFVNRIRGEFKPTANFDVEVYVESMTEEVDENDNKTGRVKVEGILPIYNGEVMPITFFSTKDTTYGDIGRYLLDNYETGKTVAIGGSLACTIKESSNTVTGFGAPVTRTFVSFTYENIIERGNEKPYLITDPKSFDKSAIKAALLYRNERIEQRVAEEKAKGTSYDNGFGSASSSSSTVEYDASVSESDFF